jgi:hAT family C-terminal dimerisation region
LKYDFFFKRLGILEKDVFTLSTDGASNEVAAATLDGFCDFAEHVWCFLHRLNLCIGDAFSGRCRARGQNLESQSQASEPSDESREPSKQSNPRGTSRRGRSKANEFWKNPSSESYSRDRSKGREIVRELCAQIRSLEASVDPLEEEDDEEETKAILILTQLPRTALEIWESLRTIMKKMRQSHIYRNLLKKACERVGVPYKTPLLYSKTRWVGSFFEVECFLDLEKPILSLQSEELKEKLHLPVLFFPAVKELYAVLEILAFPNVQLQRNTPLVSKQILYAKLIEKNIRLVETDLQLGSIQTFAKVLRESFCFRFHGLLRDVYDDDEVSPFLAAMMLDPSLTRLWKESSLTCTEHLISYCRSIAEDFDTTLDFEHLLQPSRKRRREELEDTRVVGPPKKKRFATMYSMFSLETLFQETPGETPAGEEEVEDRFAALDDEVRKYVRYVIDELCPSDPHENPLPFWKLVGQQRFPLVAAIARLVLGQPIGTADTERQCSSAGNIVSKTRNQLGNEKIDKLWMIHANSKAGWIKNKIPYID